MAHSHAEDPIKEFLDLLEESNLPPLMKQGMMESKLPKHYLLLHDDSSPTSFAKYGTSELQNHFSSLLNTSELEFYVIWSISL